MIKKNQKGFSLVELLVVVAIIGILAAVGVVTYNGYIQNARQTTAAQNHSSLVSLVTAEAAKCALNQSSTFMTTESICAGTLPASTNAGSSPCTCLQVLTAETSDDMVLAIEAYTNANFENPYGLTAPDTNDTGDVAFGVRGTPVTACDEEPSADSHDDQSIVGRGTIHINGTTDGAAYHNVVITTCTDDTTTASQVLVSNPINMY